MVESPRGASKAYALKRDTLVVRGPDRKTWLDGLLTNKVTDVAPGSAGYGLLLTKQGKIVTDVFLADSGAELLLGVAPGRGGSVRQLLDRYLVMEDAELEEPSSQPHWAIGASVVAPASVPPLASGTLSLGELRTELEVRAELDSLPDAADLLAEHGLGVFGVDFGERDNPHEASLDRIAVSWTKGCYLGQEVVCMQDMRGKVKRRLVALDGSAALLGVAGGVAEVVAADGSVAGQVTSVHQAAGGARLLATISTSILDAQGELRALGEPLRVAFGAASNLS
jgi:folate-binding protein YgfZ